MAMKQSLISKQVLPFLVMFGSLILVMFGSLILATIIITDALLHQFALVWIGRCFSSQDDAIEAFMLPTFC